MESHRTIDLFNSIGCETKHAFRQIAHVFRQIALLVRRLSSNDSILCVDMAIWRDFTVGVQKGGFMVETL